MAFSARTRAVARAGVALLAFYVGFGVLAWGARMVEWGALEALRMAGAFEAVHWWAATGRGLVALALPNLVAALVLYWVITRFLHWARGDLGWPARPWRDLGRGFGWGVGLAAAVVLVCVAGGARVAGDDGGAGGYLAVAFPLLVGLTGAALLEELLFRGFPLARLAQATGRVTAAAVLAVAFAVAHAWNPELALLGLVNIGLASLLLSLVFFGPGGLAAAWGLHTGWNVGLALGADAPVSGLAFRLPAVAYHPGPREWLTGGPFGPEGGLAATMVLGTAAAWWGHRVLRGGEVAAT